MRKATILVSTLSETILAFVLLGVVATSFLLTYNLSNINTKKETQNEVLGTFVYSETFNPVYSDDEFIKVKDAGLDVGGKSLNVSIESRKNEETIKIITIFNRYDFTMNLNVILDLVKLDSNANYYLIANDKEQLVKDSYKPEQNNLNLVIEPQKEVSLSIKVKSMERVSTEFNVIFSEN